MRALEECNYSIIGLGYLMEYIFPCLRAVLGQRAGCQVEASTADEADLEGKRQRLGIPVRLEGNLEMLLKQQPDYILFAPPPAVAPQLLEECLVPYYQHIRETGNPLPKLLAFPPSPAGGHYLERLGADIRVVNIIPNMISSINGRIVQGGASHLFTFPEQDNWSREEKNELARLFRPMGRCMELTPAWNMSVLAAEIAAHPLTELADMAAKSLLEQGVKTDYRQCAGFLRSHHLKTRCYADSLPNPPRAFSIPENFQRRLELANITWYQAMRGVLAQTGLTEEEIRTFLDPLFNLYYYEAEQEDRDLIVSKARKDATPGGMLELCMQGYSDLLVPTLERLFSCPEEALIHSARTLETRLQVICAAVTERGRHLAETGLPPFAPKDHALLFAYAAKASQQLLGERAEDYWKAVVSQYGRERGRRMARLCIQKKEPLDMEHYFSRSEWTVDVGFEKHPLPDSCLAYEVRSCPWEAAWRERDLLRYGQHYCRYIDMSILEGFSPKLRLYQPRRLTDLDGGACEFHWLDAKKPTEPRQSASQEGIRDFLFHTAHLYAVFRDRAWEISPDFACDWEAELCRTASEDGECRRLMSIITRAECADLRSGGVERPTEGSEQ